MIAAAALAAYALAAGSLAPPVLRRDWASRAPRFAIGLWLVLSASWVAAVLLAILAVAAPAMLTWGAAGAGAATATGAVTAGQAAPGLVTAWSAGLLLVAAVLARAGGCLACGLARARRERREHAAVLDATGQADHLLGAVVLGQQVPAAYCLPGRRRRIVVSAGTLAALQPAQLQAVLAHERAHLCGRHHLLLVIASAASRAFPTVPLLAAAGPEVAVLAEMAADDQAVRRHEPGDLAAALVILAAGRSHAAALTAGGPAAIARIQRLLVPPGRPTRPARAARLAAAAAAVAVPAAVICLPLLVAACGTVS